MIDVKIGILFIRILHVTLVWRMAASLVQVQPVSVRLAKGGCALLVRVTVSPKIHRRCRVLG